MPRNIIESVQGTLDFLILKTLSRGEMHGYAIARWIFDHSGEELQVEEGTLYPALHRLEDKGWISAEWGLSENNPASQVLPADLGRPAGAGGPGEEVEALHDGGEWRCRRAAIEDCPRQSVRGRDA